MSARRVAVSISGLVQGVFFRASTAEQAKGLGVTGWIANAPAGHIDAEFQGEPAAVEELLGFCRRGPSAARVDDIEVTDLDARADDTGFSVR